MMKTKPFFSIKSVMESPLAEKAPHNERIAAYCLLVLALLLKVAAVFLYYIDSDEPQHLHIVWGWAHGFLQYRDFFDNHAPLFHILCVPLLKVFGENTHTLFAMRLAMVPLYFAVLWCTYVLGREVFSERCGLWAAAFTGLCPYYFLDSIEYRPDSLWAVFWLLAILALIKGGLRASRGFWVGFLLGAALGVSIKTTFLIFSLGAGTMAMIIFSKAFHIVRPAFRRLINYGLALAAGLCVIPGALILCFYTQGALAPFFYQTIQYNMITGLGLWDSPYKQMFVFTVLLALLFGIAGLIGRHTVQEGMRSKRIIIFLMCGLYFSALIAFCPLMEAEHFFPFYPLFFILFTPLAWKLRVRPLPGWAAAALILFLEISILAWAGHFTFAHVKIGLLKDVLRLTGETDFVADLKGETIFRPRASYYVLEEITRTRFKRGLLQDDIPERLIATRTCVATLDDHCFPSRARAFLNENYIPVGSLRVAGKMLPALSGSSRFIFFDIKIPTEYVLISENGLATGWMDGAPYDGGVLFLRAGYHEFRPVAPTARFAVVWAKAKQKGYYPSSFFDTIK